MHPEALTEREAKILARLIPLIVDTFDCPTSDVKLEARFVEDLSADSLGLVECILAVEEAFELDIPDEVAEKLDTVGDAVRYIAGAPAARVPS